jgi:hypothetical protein
MRSYVITPAAGKRLIGKAVARHPAVQAAVTSGTLVIVAGTTNGYVAEEVLGAMGESASFSRHGFYRGITLPPVRPDMAPKPADAASFPGDVVIANGKRVRGKTIADIADALKEGDVIVKGANALDLRSRRAAVLIGDTRGGTTALAMQAVVGRRVRLIVPVGLEKRVATDVDQLAAEVNAPGSTGPRLYPLIGEVVTELEAVEILTGATAELMAGGGVCGAEGSVWLGIEGTLEQMEAADALLTSIAGEPPFEL